jgi:hypothetical protein
VLERGVLDKLLLLLGLVEHWPQVAVEVLQVQGLLEVVRLEETVTQVQVQERLVLQTQAQAVGVEQVTPQEVMVVQVSFYLNIQFLQVTL